MDFRVLGISANLLIVQQKGRLKGIGFILINEVDAYAFLGVQFRRSIIWMKIINLWLALSEINMNYVCMIFEFRMNMSSTIIY